MTQIVYRHDPRQHERRHPRDAAEALAWLNEGNERFARIERTEEQVGDHVCQSLVLDADLGVDSLKPQSPFGIVLSCADARVPIELVLGRGVNDLFVLRVAGNTIGSDGIGSIDYAVHHFPSIMIAAVVGHSDCGAVGAAVNAFLTPQAFLDVTSSLARGWIVDRVLPAVRVSAAALQFAHGESVGDAIGYEAALCHMAVALSAAYNAYWLRVELSRDPDYQPVIVWGVYDLPTRRVAIPGASEPGLDIAPVDADEFRALSRWLAGSRQVEQLLKRPPAADGALD